MILVNRNGITKVIVLSGIRGGKFVLLDPDSQSRMALENIGGAAGESTHKMIPGTNDRIIFTDRNRITENIV